MHKMNIENVFGTKLNLCKDCGANYDRKNKIWFSVGAYSEQEPPCNLNSEEWKKWRSQATKVKD